VCKTVQSRPGILPSLSELAPQTAAAIRAERLSPAALDELLGRSDRYYDANWVWFGLAATDGILAERTPRPEAMSLKRTAPAR
jgi:hypothetical protein